MPNQLKQDVCEEQLYQRIYKDYAETLYKQLYYKYGATLGPKDKVQEAFIKLWQHCKDVLPNKAKGYVYTIANNLMLNEWKHRKVVLKYTETTEAAVDNDTPEALLRQKEYLQLYQQALSKLTKAQREAFLLNRIEGKRHKEIAKELGISTKAVEKRLYGAIKTLQGELSELQGRKF